MPVNLGSQPDHGFDQPLGLMRDCHRRIEKFLGVLLRVVHHTRGGPLDDEHREALAAALRYFKNAAPWHTRDEEDSLFPRMRESSDPQVRDALAKVDALESDHKDAEAHHARIDQLGHHWLEHGTLDQVAIDELGERLEALRQLYQRHIAQEDDVIFRLAERTLSAHQITAIGREMAERRGVEPALPPRRCRHGRAAASAQSSDPQSNPSHPEDASHADERARE